MHAAIKGALFVMGLAAVCIPFGVLLGFLAEKLAKWLRKFT